MIRRFAELLDAPEAAYKYHKDCIYDILKYSNTRLCLDVGAAAGLMTEKISAACSAGDTIIGFEPFTNNHAFYIKMAESLPTNIQLIKKAVSDKVGTSNFTVRTTVKGTEPGWEHLVGYSSLGKLSFDNTQIDEQTVEVATIVKTTTIDDEFPNQSINFMKVDVQGAEEHVLLGARKALAEQRIDIMYIEWAGEPEVIAALSEHGYVVFDSSYHFQPKDYNLAPLEDIGFHCIKTVNLSTGKKAYIMNLVDERVNPEDAIAKVQDQKMGYIQTDLIVVSKNTLNSFKSACKQFTATLN